MTSQTRTWLCVALLVLVPFAVYWQTVFHEYGFRDDYAHLREVREEPAKLYDITAENGRPVYGVVLEASLQRVLHVPDLEWLRLTSVVLLAAFSVALWWCLRRASWLETDAAAIALAMVLFPGAQVVVGWAIAWPVTLALLLAVLGFTVVEAHLERTGPKRAAALLGGALLYTVAGLTYQTSALFAVVPLAALLLVRPEGRPFGHARWAFTHIAILFVCLVVGFVLTKLQVFASDGLVPEAARMTIEPHPFIKLLWFARQPLVNAVGLFALRDRFDTGLAYWAAVFFFGGLLSLGFWFGGKGFSHRARWLFCLLFLPFVAHSVSLAASSQAIGYRTIFPLAGLVVVLVVFALRSLVAAGVLRPARALAVLLVLGAVAAIAAQRNSYTLIAQPQAREWDLVRDSVNRLPLGRDTDVFIIRPQIENRSTVRTFADEFGSLSADADWSSKEMFKAAIRLRFPDTLPAGFDYTVQTGLAAPNPAEHDVVIDLRRLRDGGDPLSITHSNSSVTRN